MTFQTGTSGNPGGRPRGTGTRQQVFSALVEPHREALFEVAIDMALKGNEAMLRVNQRAKMTPLEGKSASKIDPLTNC
jgi:hypothetical protein